MLKDRILQAQLKSAIIVKLEGCISLDWFLGYRDIVGNKRINGISSTLTCAVLKLLSWGKSMDFSVEDFISFYAILLALRLCDGCWMKFYFWTHGAWTKSNFTLKPSGTSDWSEYLNFIINSGLFIDQHIRCNFKTNLWC